jgi:hypothetical protein
MLTEVRTRVIVAACLPVLLAAVSACDIVTANNRVQEKAEWRKSYELQAGGRVEVVNVNGKIDVEPSDGNRVEVVAWKVARGSTADAAREALGRIEILESASSSAVRIETRLPRAAFLNMGGSEVQYTVKVPAAAIGRFTTTNGGIDVSGVQGRVTAETTNGGIRGREVGGAIEASSTNGGIDVELTRVAEEGVKLECTNGGIKLRLPADARATVSASITNGGINTDGLSLEVSESTRRRLEARMNGGGPAVRLEGTNGGIRIAGR